MRNAIFATGLILATSATAASAATLQITATSASAGELGYFVVDEDVLALDTSLVASQFEDFYFVSPVSGDVYDPTTVLSDTGVTYFSEIGGVWTVTGGGGDSLTTVDGNVWIAGTTYVTMDNFTVSYSDVTWSTEVFMAAVPLPAAGSLMILGLGGIAALRRRKKS